LGKTRSVLGGRPNGPRILLCEDDAKAAVVLCERLWQAGFTTDVAYSAAEATECAGATTYAAILVDLQVPDGAGVSLIKQLGANPHCCNTLLVVASADPKQAPDNSKSAAMLNILDWLYKPIEANRLVQVLDRRIVPGTGTRLRILHVDDDHELIRVIAQTFNSSAEVMSVDSIDAARRVLAANRFDVAVLNAGLASGSGLDLLLELHDVDGDAIPVIVISALDADAQYFSRIHAGLSKSRTSVHRLVTTLRGHLAGRATGDKDAA
jgi:DNA-binding response OmpR family regulator